MPYSPTIASYFGIAETADLLITPIESQSLAFQLPTQIRTAAATFRIPTVAQDPSAAWVAETEEIPTSEAAGGELEIIPKKVAGLTLVSNEAAADTSPEATQLIGDGLARDISRKIDQAYFGAKPSGTGSAALVAKMPTGLEWLPTGGASGISVIDAQYYAAGIDPFVDALATASHYGATVSAFVASGDVVTALSKLKVDANQSRVPLFGSNATNGISRQILGIPLITGTYVRPNTVWALSAQNFYTVLRDDVTVDVDRSRYFERDVVAIRGRLRVGFGYANIPSIAKITYSKESVVSGP